MELSQGARACKCNPSPERANRRARLSATRIVVSDSDYALGGRLLAFLASFHSGRFAQADAAYRQARRTTHVHRVFLLHLGRGSHNEARNSSFGHMREWWIGGCLLTTARAAHARQLAGGASRLRGSRCPRSECAAAPRCWGILAAACEELEAAMKRSREAICLDGKLATEEKIALLALRIDERKRGELSTGTRSPSGSRIGLGSFDRLRLSIIFPGLGQLYNS